MDPMWWPAITAIVGAVGAMIWSFSMAKYVAAPRAKKLIVSALTTEGEELQAVRAHLINPALEAQYEAISAQTGAGGTEMAQSLENALNEGFSALQSEIGPIVYSAINQVKAQETKSLQAQLEELGLNEVVGEAKDVVASQLPPQMLQAQRLLQMKVSKKYAAEHPLEAQAIEMGKLWVMQLLEGGMAGLPGMQRATASEAPSANRGFGVR